MPADTRVTAALAVLDAARETLAAVLEEGPGDNGGGPAPALLLKFDQAAVDLGASRTAVFELVKRGELPAVEVPGVGRRIRRVDLEAFVEGLGRIHGESKGRGS